MVNCGVYTQIPAFCVCNCGGRRRNSGVRAGVAGAQNTPDIPEKNITLNELIL